VRIAVGGLVVAGASGAVGCLNRPIEPVEPRTTSTIVERLTQSAVDKIDLLLAIDNSRSMADKQAILADAVPDLVKGLVNPKCVDKAGVPAGTQPASPTEDCPTGYEREFNPVLDIHIGIISSSIGGFGAPGMCKPSEPSANDQAHLLARTAYDQPNTIPTWENKGFLAWDPAQKLDPPGEGDVTALNDRLKEMVTGVGQSGCGYEAQLESVYRFLADPEPYATLALTGPDTNKVATPEGLDMELLQQRADFLRPDSLLAIVMLSDENDCSFREGSFYWAGANNAQKLPLARPECADDPNDPCCMSCLQTSDQCPFQAACYVNGDPNQGVAYHDKPLVGDTPNDRSNLRCFDQKRRFGIDFLYPVDRYVKAFRDPTITNRKGELVANPIFSNLNPNNVSPSIRDSGLVFFAGIVGVPWQDIARQDAEGKPSLLGGLDLEGNPVGGLKSADELLRPIKLPDGSDGPTGWDLILGDPKALKAPADPHMIESIEPREGTNPLTGAPLAQPGVSDDADPINGNEYFVSGGPNSIGDLQYACIFPLPSPRDCQTATGSCDCKNEDPEAHNPLCDAPAGGTAPTTQVRAKAYPGIRELQVIQGLGAQGIVGSVCPAQLDDVGSDDYGYRPAIGAIIDRLKTRLGGQCLPRTLTPDDQGHVSCLILEARNSQGQCDCNMPGRQEVLDGNPSSEPDHTQARNAVLRDPLSVSAGFDCACEIVQLPNGNDAVPDADELKACQYSLEEPGVTEAGAEVNGWCYIDATTSPPTGDPAIVDSCPENERRLIRFAGKGEAQPGATMFITCAGE
jgi:hypothetical protein